MNLAEIGPPSHYACYCPDANNCNSKGRLGWAESEAEARNKVANHLISSTYHGMSEEQAHEMALNADLDTWGTHKSQQTSSRKELRDPQPKRARKSDGDGDGSTQGALVPTSKAHSSQSSSQGSGALVAAYKSRAESAEEQLVYVQSIMTRVVEQLTKSAASCKTAARFARTAAEAFDSEYHVIQGSIDQIQAMYSAVPEQ